MTAFVRDVLGMTPIPAVDDWAIFQLPSSDRDFFEVHGPTQVDERLMPLGVDYPVVAFAVDDLDEARAELEAAGTEVIGETVWAAEAFGNPSLAGYGWLFFRAPDGHVYILQQERAPGDGA
jgi:catechol 2,3-dioxygenase-like lactoylglutathione lyase family enzyme